MDIRERLLDEIKFSREEIENRMEKYKIMKINLLNSNGSEYELNSVIINDLISHVAFTLTDDIDIALNFLENEIANILKK